MLSKRLLLFIVVDTYTWLSTTFQVAGENF